MDVVVQNLYPVNGRWKYRVVIPEGLRPHFEKGKREFVRSLGPISSNRKLTPEQHRKYAECSEEFRRLLEQARKRAGGGYDVLTPPLASFIIESARADLLEQDEEAGFDDVGEDQLYAQVAEQIGKATGSVIRR